MTAFPDTTAQPGPWQVSCGVRPLGAVTAMGYNVYITRAPYWWEHDVHPIFRSEWDAVVAADSSLRVSTEDWVDRQTNQGRIERIYAVIWSEQPDHVAFWYVDGAIRTKNPDVGAIEKMVELAKRLQARVLGEENEEYRTGGLVVRDEG